MSKFKCVNNKGFQMTFDNGWTASVMWGRGNYCENNHADVPWPHEAGLDLDSQTAEVWSWKGNVDRGDPSGWQTTNNVAEFLAEVANRCHCGRPAKQYDSDHCEWCGCEEYQRTCDEVFNSNPDA